MASGTDRLEGIDNEGLELQDTVSDEWKSSPKKKYGISKSVSMDTEQPACPSHWRTAVSVENASKYYKSEKGTTKVLKNFNLTVKQGSIYSLLGASGCGKTTLLSCIVGLKKLNSGDVFVFGDRPGTEDSGVPGKRVGYMPQETALFGEFSIQETLHFYGRIYSMTRTQIEENISFLIVFLKLPPAHRRISSLSGGQQRRVSFAVGLIHNPELLILDEPTVGVDALLRQSIWNHLVKLVSTGKTTVIITTHYIEEARQSNMIGLMRSGKLLVEDSPNNLMKMYKTNLLEDIVMTLCLKDNGQDKEVSSYAEINTRGDICNSNVNRTGPHSYQKENSSTDAQDLTTYNWRKLHRASVIAELRHQHEQMRKFQESMNRILALSVKNICILLRNITFLSFILLVPAMQVISVCLAVGGDPKGLKFGVVNYELPLNSADSTCPAVTGCPFNDDQSGLISCKFLSYLDVEYIEMIEYVDEDAAIEDVKMSKIWGVLSFPCNFTDSFKERIMLGNNAEIGSILASRLDIRMDVSNNQIGTQLSKYFHQSLVKMARNISLTCEIEPEKSESPIHYGTPIYGNEKTDFREYLAASALVGILFFFPLSSSGLSFITEKRMGTLDRSTVAGVTTAEFTLAYSGIQFFILIIQTAFAFGFLILVFDITVNGPLILAAIMSLLIGVAGVSAGFVLSICCTEEIQAVLLALGMFFPNLLLSGMIWSIEGMPLALQYASYGLPCTLACETMRSVVSRGLGLDHPKVWPGFLSTTLWILLYWILFAIIHKVKANR